MQWVKATRTLFGYLQLGSLLETVRWLDAEGWLNKRYQTVKGQWRGEKDFDKSTLQKMLTNPLYLGRIAYQGHMYDGEHDATSTRGG